MIKVLHYKINIIVTFTLKYFNDGRLPIVHAPMYLDSEFIIKHNYFPKTHLKSRSD